MPCVPALLQPATRTRAFPGVAVPPRPRLGGPLNYLSYLVGEQLSWQPFRATVNRWRRETLGLPPIPLGGPYAELQRRRLPFLYGVSRQVVPRPPDWPTWHHLTGYWFLDRLSDWEPATELADFLATGPPPVYVGFGSMKPGDAVALGRLAVAALRRAKRRGVLLTGWSGLRAGRASDDVLIVDEVPHDWLFPRMAAVVHHGGAGTTAAGLRAGVPSVVCPFFVDQPFWGWRVAELGVGPPPIMQSRLTVDRLTAAIRRAVADEAMAARASALGERVRAEDDVARAVELFEQEIGRRGKGDR